MENEKEEVAVKDVGSGKPPISMKQKLIVGAVLAAIGIAVASNFIHFSPKKAAEEEALSAGKWAFNKGKEKARDKFEAMKEKHERKVAERASEQNANASSPSAASAPSAETGYYKPIASNDFISIDNLPVKPEFANNMMMTAISAGDLKRVQYLLASGLSPVFDDDHVCLYNKAGYGLAAETKPMPANFNDLKSMVWGASFSEMYTTDCSKLFLLKAADQLDEKLSPKEYWFYHSKPSKDADASTVPEVKIEEQREAIYEAILKLTPQKDWYQLDRVALNRKIPFAIRADALNKYIYFYSHESSISRSKKAIDFWNLVETSLKQANSGVPIKSDPYFGLNTAFFNEFFNADTSFEQVIDDVNRKLAQHRLPPMPDLTVKAMEDGEIDYKGPFPIIGYIGTRNSQLEGAPELHELNDSIRLIKTMMDSKVVNFNYQDADGNTILHYVSKLAFDRVHAVAIRYLLDSGVNGNLLNKAGESAFMYSQQVQEGIFITKNPRANQETEVYKAFTDKNYN